MDVLSSLLKANAANLKFQNICVIHELIEFATPDSFAQIM